jgi:hypothetical protein
MHTTKLQKAHHFRDFECTFRGFFPSGFESRLCHDFFCEHVLDVFPSYERLVTEGREERRDERRQVGRGHGQSGYKTSVTLCSPTLHCTALHLPALHYTMLHLICPSMSPAFFTKKSVISFSDSASNTVVGSKSAAHTSTPDRSIASPSSSPCTE